MNSKEKVSSYEKKAMEASKTAVPFAVVEAYKTIRTNLMYILSQKKEKIVVVSSCLPGEGKSTTAINVGIAFSQLGSKTLVIDADLRMATLHKKIKVSNQKGLSSVLVGFDDVHSVINTVNSNLDVITSGPIPPNPSELMSSKTMDALLKTLAEEYDYIIIDTPPIGIVSDSLALAPKTAGILLVIQDRHTTHDELKKTLSSIELAQSKVLGTVLNNFDSEKSGYYYKGKTKKYRHATYADA